MVLIPPVQLRTKQTSVREARIRRDPYSPLHLRLRCRISRSLRDLENRQLNAIGSTWTCSLNCTITPTREFYCTSPILSCTFSYYIEDKKIVLNKRLTVRLIDTCSRFVAFWRHLKRLNNYLKNRFVEVKENIYNYLESIDRR